MLYYSPASSLLLSSLQIQLKHIPTGLSVSCHETRECLANHKIARRKLTEKVEQLLYGSESKLSKKIEKIKTRKANATKRSQKKYRELDELKNRSVESSEDADKKG